MVYNHKGEEASPPRHSSGESTYPNPEGHGVGQGWRPLPYFMPYRAEDLSEGGYPMIAQPQQWASVTKATAPTTSGPATAPAKRGRGRPRKHPLPTLTPTAKTPSIPSAAPKFDADPSNAPATATKKDTTSKIDRPSKRPATTPEVTSSPSSKTPPQKKPRASSIDLSVLNPRLLEPYPYKD